MYFRLGRRSDLDEPADARQSVGHRYIDNVGRSHGQQSCGEPYAQCRRRADAVVGCAELAPLSRAVAEVRSLVVDESCRGRGFGSRIVEELNRWAVQEGFSTLCAFTHNAAHFVRLGFSIVPHPWLPEKIATDCVGCPKFRQCTQYAMALPLRGRSLRSSPAGQRPYLAMPETVAPIVPHQGRTIGADGVLGV